MTEAGQRPMRHQVRLCTTTTKGKPVDLEVAIAVAVAAAAAVVVVECCGRPSQQTGWQRELGKRVICFGCTARHERVSRPGLGREFLTGPIYLAICQLQHAAYPAATGCR